MPHIITNEEIERDPIMRRLAVVSMDSPEAEASLYHYRAGGVSREEVLIACIELLAERGKRLFDLAKRATELLPPSPIVIKFDSKEQAEKAIARAMGTQTDHGR